MREIVPRTRRCGGQIADHVAGQAAYRRTCRSTRLGRWRRREQGAQNRLVDACSGHAAPMRPTSTMTDSTQNCDNRFVASLKNRRNCVTLHTSAMGGRPHEDPGIKRPVLRCQPDGIVMVAGVAAVAAVAVYRVSRLWRDSVSTRKGSADEPASCIRSSSEIWFPASAPLAATSRRRGETGGQHRPRSTVLGRCTPTPPPER